MQLSRGGESSSEVEINRLRRKFELFSCAMLANELTGLLTHDISQPLAAISLNAQVAMRLLESGNPNLTELREILEDIITDDRRISEEIRGVRSRLKKKKTDRQTIRLDELILEIMPIVRQEALERDISVDLELAASLPAAKGDRMQLQQVILILVSNAFDAMESTAKPSRLVLRNRRKDQEILLDVEDSGPGIPSDSLTSIFHPFVTTKEARLGMGLALSRSVLIGHNGRIWAENNEKGGAIFHLALPIEHSLEAVSSDKGNQIQRAIQDKDGLTVLIADDREAFRRAVASVLSGLHGLRSLYEAHNGEEAIQKASELKPDLILLDVGLPIVNGVEAAGRIRSAVPNARIMFLTQHESPEFVSASLATGALGYVLKVDIGSELLLATQAVLRGEQYLSSGIRRAGMNFP